MAKVTVELPGLLRQLLGAPPSIAVEAETVEAALRAADEACPGLAVHLFDETGSVRPHVLLFHNDTNTRWTGPEDRRLAPGDRITILQAVSGG